MQAALLQKAGLSWAHAIGLAILAFLGVLILVKSTGNPLWLAAT